MGAVAQTNFHFHTNMLFLNAFNLDYLNDLIANKREAFEKQLPETITVTVTKQTDVDVIEETEVCVSILPSDMDGYIEDYVDELRYFEASDKNCISQSLPFTEGEEIFLSSQSFLTEGVKRIYSRAIDRLCKNLESQYIATGHVQTHFENSDVILYRASMQLEDPDRDFEMDF